MSSIISFQELVDTLYLDGWYSAEGARDVIDYTPIPDELLRLPAVQSFSTHWQWSPFKGDWSAKLMGALYAADRLPLYESKQSASARENPIVWSPHEFITHWNNHRSIAIRADELHDCLTGVGLPLPARLFPESELNTNHAMERGADEFGLWFNHYAEIQRRERIIAALERDRDNGKYTDLLTLEEAIESKIREIARLKAADTPFGQTTLQNTLPTPVQKKPTFDECFPSGNKAEGDWGLVLHSVLCDFIKERGCPGHKSAGVNAVYAFLSRKTRVLSFEISSGKHDGKDCLLLDKDPGKFLTKETLRGKLKRWTKPYACRT